MEQELPLAAGRGDRPRHAARAASSGRSTGLRVAPFYGCYIVRPREAPRLRRPPRARPYLEQVIEALGGDPGGVRGRHKCCGFPVITMNTETSLRQAGRHMADAIDAGADCVVTPCPLCHLNLDLQQPEAAKFVERDLGIPVLHLPQLRRPRARARAEGARDEQARRDHARGAGESGRPRRRLRCKRQSPPSYAECLSPPPGVRWTLTEWKLEAAGAPVLRPAARQVEEETGWKRPRAEPIQALQGRQVRES